MVEIMCLRDNCWHICDKYNRGFWWKSIWSTTESQISPRAMGRKEDGNQSVSWVWRAVRCWGNTHEMTTYNIGKHVWNYHIKHKKNLWDDHRRKSPEPEPHSGGMGANNEGTQSHRKKVRHNMLNCANLIVKICQLFTFLLLYQDPNLIWQFLQIWVVNDFDGFLILPGWPLSATRAMEAVHSWCFLWMCLYNLKRHAVLHDIHFCFLTNWKDIHCVNIYTWNPSKNV